MIGIASSLFKSYRKPANTCYRYVANTSSRISISATYRSLNALAICFWRIQKSPTTWRAWVTTDSTTVTPATIWLFSTYLKYVPPYNGLNYPHQEWNGTTTLNPYDCPCYPSSSSPQLPISTSTPSKGFLHRRSQVVPTSSTSSLDILNWLFLTRNSITSSHAVKSQHPHP